MHTECIEQDSNIRKKSNDDIFFMTDEQSAQDYHQSISKQISYHRRAILAATLVMFAACFLLYYILRQ